VERDGTNHGAPNEGRDRGGVDREQTEGHMTAKIITLNPALSVPDSFGYGIAAARALEILQPVYRMGAAICYRGARRQPELIYSENRRFS
jgi:hypothetical protein